MVAASWCAEPHRPIGACKHPRTNVTGCGGQLRSNFRVQPLLIVVQADGHNGARHGGWLGEVAQLVKTTGTARRGEEDSSCCPYHLHARDYKPFCCVHQQKLHPSVICTSRSYAGPCSWQGMLPICSTPATSRAAASSLPPPPPPPPPVPPALRVSAAPSAPISWHSTEGASCAGYAALQAVPALDTHPRLLQLSERSDRTIRVNPEPCPALDSAPQPCQVRCALVPSQLARLRPCTASVAAQAASRI